MTDFKAISWVWFFFIQYDFLEKYHRKVDPLYYNGAPLLEMFERLLAFLWQIYCGVTKSIDDTQTNVYCRV